MATKTVKAKAKNLGQRIDAVKSTAKYIHDETLQVSEDIVDASLKTGAKWQGIMAKVMQQGVVIFGKQQDLMIDTITDIKGQYEVGAKRFKKLINFDIPKVERKTVKKAAKKVSKTVAAKSAKAKVTVKPTAQKDNLTKVEGIGPKIATLLNQAGITTFTQLAKTEIKNLQAILDAAGPRYKAHDPKTWRIQAKRLMK